MLEPYEYFCGELFELLVVVQSVSPETRLLERSYSKLEEVGKKEWNNYNTKSIIESLWLSNLPIPTKGCFIISLFDGIKKILSQISK